MDDTAEKKKTAIKISSIGFMITIYCVLMMPLLSIRNLNVSYATSEYVIANLSDIEFVGELTRYLRLIQGGGISILGGEYRHLRERIVSELRFFKEKGYFNVYAINNLNLDVDEGKIVACVGESGSGKSTLALAIIRALPENARISGQIFFREKNILEISEMEMRILRATKLGYIGQGSYTYLNPLMTNAYQTLESAIVAKRGKLDEAFKAFVKTIEAMELDRRVLLTYPDKLSGGQVRRVAFAIAFVKEPELFICDEPFRHLDTFLAKQLASLLQRMIHRLETTAIIFTHNLSLMAEIADEIAIMYHGIIVEKGNVIDIFRKPYHPYTKGLIGAIPDIRFPKKKIVYIPGEPLPRIIKPTFCPFFNRCPVADDECINSLPEPREFDGRIVACHKIDEIWDKTPVEFWEKVISE